MAQPLMRLSEWVQGIARPAPLTRCRINPKEAVRLPKLVSPLLS